MEQLHPLKSLEAGDPFEFVTVRYPVDSTRQQDLEMARCFIEEYALVGWSGSQIRQLFKSPLYVGPHAIYQRCGMEAVDDLIRDVFLRERNDG